MASEEPCAGARPTDPEETHLRQIMGRYLGRIHDLNLHDLDTRSQLMLDLGALAGIAVRLITARKTASIIGPTGEYPGGTLSDADVGGINIAVSAHEGHVIVAFGAPLMWIGMTPDQARAIAKGLQTRALQAEAQLEGVAEHG